LTSKERAIYLHALFAPIILPYALGFDILQV